MAGLAVRKSTSAPTQPINITVQTQKDLTPTKMQQSSNRKKTLRAGTPGVKEEKVTHGRGVRVRVMILGRIGVRAGGTNGTKIVLSRYI